MQWTGPHTGQETDAIRVHGEYNSTGAASAGDAMMWAPASTPGFADRRLVIAAGNTVDTDFTGYRVMSTEFHPSIAFPVIAGILEEDVPARALATFPIMEIPPIQMVAFGRVNANVVFPGDRETGTPLIPDSANNGKLRPLDTSVNILSNPTFASGTDWTPADGFTIGSGTANYAHDAAGGTLTQATADFLQNFQASTKYRFTFSGTPGGGFDTGGAAATITAGFAAAPVTLPKTAGVHTVEFTSAAAVANFVIDVTGSGAAETWVIDNVRLSPVTNPDEDALQHLVCGHLLEDWTGGAATGSVRIMARCL